MSEEEISGPPRSFYVISGAALIWNLFGVLSYIGRVTASEATLAAMPDLQRAYAENAPTWETAAFAIATNAGALGCLFLLLKRSWAYPVLIASFVAILVQNFYGYAIGGAVEVFGPVGVVLSVAVMVIGALLVWYSKGANEKGWLK